jgi:hypothetical protein
MASEYVCILETLSAAAACLSLSLQSTSKTCCKFRNGNQRLSAFVACLNAFFNAYKYVRNTSSNYLKILLLLVVRDYKHNK